MRVRTLASAVPVLFLASPAAAQVYPSFGGGSPTYSQAELQMMHRYELQKLRAEALRQQAADGGRLSTASLARLQAKLDELNAGLVRSLHNNDTS